jgi:EAL domain-containing protein (putative c-di-GMP-specific phosphodiesterase class I)
MAMKHRQDFGPGGTEIRSGDGDPFSHAVALDDARTIATVRTAIETRSLRLAYQPIHASHMPDPPAFYEGLIRVLDPTGRVIPARDFINTVEQLDLGRLIDCAALELGLNALLKHPRLRLSINMSARSIGYPRWTAILRRGLRAGHTVGERLILEIAESSVNLVPELVAGFMESLQPEGVCFALDGFGAGLTALRHLRDFYFDILKIDGQFIRDIDQNPGNRMLVRSFVLMAQQFDLLTVAEAVETEAEFAALQTVGVDAMQGYLLGAPSVTPDFMRKEQRRSA